MARLYWLMHSGAPANPVKTTDRRILKVFRRQLLDFAKEAWRAPADTARLNPGSVRAFAPTAGYLLRTAWRRLQIHENRLSFGAGHGQKPDGELGETDTQESRD